MKNYSKGLKNHKHLHDPAVHAPGPMFCSLFVLTVFGFGMNGAIFWAVFRNQYRTEQIWTALQLGTHPSAEVRYLVRSSYNLGHGPVCFAPVPRRKEGEGMARLQNYSDLFCRAYPKVPLSFLT